MILSYKDYINNSPIYNHYTSEIEDRQEIAKDWEILLSEMENPSKLNWLETLVDSAEELESPARFVFWAGVAAISAVIKKNVWFDRFTYKLYPNVYVILVSARSGLRKGLPVETAKSLVELVGNVRVISGRNSIQGVLKKLSEQKTLENGYIVSDAQAFLCAPELKSFMIGDDQALDILTDLHSVHEHENLWENTLKGSPVESLKSPCITLLGAANEVMFEALIQQKDLEGGFIARSFIVYESNRRTINSLMYRPKKSINKPELAVHLKQIAELKGEMKASDEVRDYFDLWYHKVADLTHSDKTGTLERIGDQCLRLATIISLSENLQLEITMKSMKLAIEECEAFFPGTKRISIGNGKAETASATKLIIRELIKTENHKLERMFFLRKLFPDVDALAFDKAIDTLGMVNGQGVLEISRGTDQKIFYALKREYVDQFRRFISEEKRSVN